MKRLLCLFAFLALTIAVLPLFAEDNPFLGTWKLNTAKSKFEPAPGPKNQTRTVEVHGNGVQYRFEGVSADDKAYGYSFVTYYDKTNAAVNGTGTPGGADAVNLKKVSSHKIEGTLWKGGKEVGKVVAEVSKDGLVTTVKGKGKSASGTEYNFETVYDKQ